MFLLVPNELEENQSINLLCTVADVESSRETLTIWKISQNNDTPELKYTSDATSAKTENCTEILNVNVTYTSRETTMGLCSDVHRKITSPKDQDQS